ncbi:CHAT domain-containing protein [Polyangium aurulentum]|uniref:CHAT domain-containing protein n=1 Tax=Polyangium aurulentum TaxID=2567896 RepID=UPI00146D43E8|nr:CHAT domain-containing protein [Polyangium aurulentum]UQA55173.1 CHAT domain-containing protein [Polyangium aurulentum]
MRPRRTSRALAALLTAASLHVLVDSPALAQPPPAPAGPAGGNWYMEANAIRTEGMALVQRGEVDAGIVKLERSLAIAEANKSDDYIALALGALAQAYVQKRDPVKVEALYQRVVDLRKKMEGPKGLFYAMALNDLGNFYFQTGRFDRAQPVLEESIAIYEAAGGTRGVGGVAPMYNLAMLHVGTGDLSRAAGLLERALTLQEGFAGKDHPAIAPFLSALGIVAHHRGELQRAEELDRRGCQMLEKMKGEGPELGQCLANLGMVLQSKGDYPAAKVELERGLAMLQYEDPQTRQRKRRGAQLQIARAVTALAQLFEATGDTPRARATFKDAVTMIDEDLNNVLASGSERDKRELFSRSSAQIGLVVSFHLGAAQNDPDALDLALRTLLRRKGRVLDAAAQGAKLLRNRLSTEEQALFDKLAAARNDLARLALGAPGTPPSGSPEAKEREANAKERIQKLEVELGERSRVYRAHTEDPTPARVQGALSDGAALVEIVRFSPYNVKWRKRDEAYRPARYAAYLVPAAGKIEAIDLGLAEEIDADVKALRTAFADPARKDATALAQALDAKVLRPILARLDANGKPAAGKPRMMYLSPDGALNLVPFVALVDGDGRPRVETITFDYLTSGRDLLLRTAESPKKEGPLVAANPDFGNAPAPGPKTGLRMLFPPLPGTAEEGRTISAMLSGSALVTDAQATEAALKRVRGPEVLHIATHGFFLGEPKDAAAKTRALELEMSNAAAGGGNAPKSTMVFPDNPLLRSGLALAGANRREGEEDGLLTALEAAGIDLWGTKLVVLSACETGVGDISNGEGVYGLRRALVLAGAQTSLMSLWQVDDEATRDLMIEYYRRLGAGEGRVEALRRAQLALLAGEGRRHPFYWAAFIASGDERPVSLSVLPPPPPRAREASSPQPPPKTARGARGCACETGAGEGAQGGWALALAAAALLVRRPRRGIAKGGARP